jgi:hypothetical protein
MNPFNSTAGAGTEICKKKTDYAMTRYSPKNKYQPKEKLTLKIRKLTSLTSSYRKAIQNLPCHLGDSLKLTA